MVGCPNVSNSGEPLPPIGLKGKEVRWSLAPGEAGVVKVGAPDGSHGCGKWGSPLAPARTSH